MSCKVWEENCGGTVTSDLIEVHILRVESIVGAQAVEEEGPGLHQVSTICQCGNLQWVISFTPSREWVDYGT